MLRTKKTKLILVIAMIFALLFPYTTPVLAAELPEITEPFKQSDLSVGQTIQLCSTAKFGEGKYYQFRKIVNGNEQDANLYKIYVKNAPGAKNAIYCVDAQKEFITGTDTNYIYKNFGNFLDKANNAEVNRFLIGNGTETNPKISNENYLAMCWMAKNMYIEANDTNG